MNKLKQLFEKRNFSLEKQVKETNINLGCGQKPLDNFINVDFYTIGNEDVKADLEQPLPFEDAYADLIYADNVFEHIKNVLQLTKECIRILKPGGKLAIRVPYYKSRGAFIDPTHINFYTLSSFDYFVKKTYFYNQYRFFDEGFSSIDCFINPTKRKGFFRNMVSNYATLAPHSFETGLIGKFTDFSSVTFLLTK